MKKPKFLYHGSPNSGLKIIEPRANSIRDEKEGAVVFATHDRVLASMFIIPTDDSWVDMGYLGETPYFHCSDLKRFMKLDKGGSIYTVPAINFENHPEKGMGDLEWTSKEAVEPIKEIKVESALYAMLENGVQIRFLTKKQLQRSKGVRKLNK